MNKKNNKKQFDYILVWDLDETLFHTSGNSLYQRPYVKETILQLGEHFHQIVFTAATKSYADEILKKMGLYNCFAKLFYRSSLTGGGRIKDLKTVIRELISDKIKYKLKDGKLKDNAVEILNMNNKLLMSGGNKISLNKIILIDNLEENLCEEQKHNGIIIKDYYGEKTIIGGKKMDKDNCLLIIKEFLLHMINMKPQNVQNYLRENLYIINKAIKYIPELPIIQEKKEIIKKNIKENINKKNIKENINKLNKKISNKKISKKNSKKRKTKKQIKKIVKKEKQKK